MKDLRQNPKQVLLTLLFNIPTWFFESLTLVILFYLDEDLAVYQIDFFIIVLAQIITFFTKTVPITPGGWGVSEAIGTGLVLLFYPSIEPAMILAVFFLDHILRIVYVFIYGGISTIAINFKFTKKEIEKIKGEQEKIS